MKSAVAYGEEKKSEIDCRRFYSSIYWDTKYRAPMMAVHKKIDESFPWNKFNSVSWKQSIEGLEQVKVNDIFYGKFVQNGKGEVSLSTDYNQINNYHKLFHSLMEARVKAGVLPGSIRNGFEDWVKEVDKSISPKLDFKLLYEEYYLKNRPLYEYFDERLLDYFVAQHDIAQATVVKAMDAMPTTFKRRFRLRLNNTIKKIPKAPRAVGKWVLAASTGGAGLALFQDLYSKLIKGVTDPFTKPAEKMIDENVKGKVETFVDNVKAGLKWPTNAPDLIKKVKEISAKLKEEDFSKLPISESAKKLKEYEASVLALLPQFHDVLSAKDKDFDSGSTKILTESKSILAINLGNYDTNRATLDTMKALIESKGLGASPDELDRIAYYTGEINDTEDQITGVLATWMMYKATRGEKSLVESGVNKDFQKGYEKFFRAMNPDKLRKKYIEAVDLIVNKIDEWQKGEGEETKKLPTLDQEPDPKSKGK